MTMTEESKELLRTASEKLEAAFQSVMDAAATSAEIAGCLCHGSSFRGDPDVARAADNLRGAARQLEGAFCGLKAKCEECEKLIKEAK